MTYTPYHFPERQVTPVTSRPLPEGFVVGKNISKAWRAGTLFTWSEVFQNWVVGDANSGRFLLTIRPREDIATAYKREMQSDMPQEVEVFFTDEE